MLHAASTITAQTVLAFWFDEIDRSCWWMKSEAFDDEIRQRFGSLWQQAAACELASWRASAAGSLAEVIVLDQFSRNLFREQPQAFAQDSLALALAQQAVASNLDQALAPERRAFLYMPYMHSESQLIHCDALNLFEALGIAQYLDFEQQHKAIIDRFGRYPHRNAIMNRESSSEELAFLAQEGSGF